MLEVLYKSAQLDKYQGGEDYQAGLPGSQGGSGRPGLTLFKYSDLYITEKYTK